MQLAFALLALFALVDADIRRPRRSIAFDCSGKLDGDYADPTSSCTPVFYKCSAIGVTMQSCPTGTVYDPLAKICNWIAAVPLCQGQASSQLPQQDATTPLNIPQTGSGLMSFSCSQNPMSPNSAPTFDCFQIANLRASLLAFDCLQKPGTVNTADNIPFDCFQKTIAGNPSPQSIVCKQSGTGSFSCSGGSGQPMFSCSSKGVSTDASKPQAFACTQVVSALPTISTMATTTLRSPPTTFQCNGRSGNFPIGPCESGFWQCANNVAFKMSCATLSQRYNPLLDQCLEAINVPGCRQSARRRRQATNAISCNGKPDGDYPMGLCQSAYYSCSPLGVVLRNCATGTAFDSQAKLCQWTTSLVECQNVVATTIESMTTVQQDVPSSFSCDGKQTGDYANPDSLCSSYFYKCTSLGATKIDCPADLIYDRSLRLCNYREAIADC